MKLRIHKIKIQEAEEKVKTEKELQEEIEKWFEPEEAEESGGIEENER